MLKNELSNFDFTFHRRKVGEEGSINQTEGSINQTEADMEERGDDSPSGSPKYKFMKNKIKKQKKNVATRLNLRKIDFQM